MMGDKNHEFTGIGWEYEMGYVQPTPYYVGLSETRISELTQVMAILNETNTDFQ